MESLFSKRLKEERLANKLTQEKLAELASKNEDTKVSRNSITRYENGTRVPDHDTLWELARVLNVDISYLIGKSDLKHFETSNNSLSLFSRNICNILMEDNSSSNEHLRAILTDLTTIIGLLHKSDSLSTLKFITGSLSLEISASEYNKDLNLLLEKYKTFFATINKVLTSHDTNDLNSIRVLIQNNDLKEGE